MKGQNTYFYLQNAYSNTSKEKFFVSYAVRGPVFANGTRQDMPVNTPLCNSPVVEPSPLNTRWKYEPVFNPIGVL